MGSSEARRLSLSALQGNPAADWPGPERTCQARNENARPGASERAASACRPWSLAPGPASLSPGPRTGEGSPLHTPAARRGTKYCQTAGNQILPEIPNTARKPEAKYGSPPPPQSPLPALRREWGREGSNWSGRRRAREEAGKRGVELERALRRRTGRRLRACVRARAHACVYFHAIYMYRERERPLERGLVWNHFQYSLSISSEFALPTATGWDEELRARTAGVRLPRQGHSESSFRTDPSVCPIMLRHRSSRPW